MKKIFISGSRKINHLPLEFEQELTRLVKSKKYEFLVGDCDGVDSLVQKLLYDLHCNDVTVYASGITPRNFYGSIEWKKRLLGYPMMENMSNYYAIKDSRMSVDCDMAMAIWDGRSKGTKNNIDRLKKLNKYVVVFKTGVK